MDFESQKNFTEGIQKKIEESFEDESLKGSSLNVYPFSVDIEPNFNKYALANFLSDTKVSHKPRAEKKQDKVFLFMWFSTLDEVAWQEFEFVFKELGVIKSSLSFLLFGNCQRISCEIAVLNKDEIAVCQILKTRFPNIQIDVNSDSCFMRFCQKERSCEFELKDFVAPEPYWHPVVNYEALKNSCSPLMSVYSTLSSLSSDEFGFYQIVFKKAHSSWRKNILNLIEGEIESGKYAIIRQPILPSTGIGAEDFREAKKKLIGPYFSVSVRIGALCRSKKVCGVLKSLSIAIASVQYSGREFSYLSKKDYLKVMNENELIGMIASGSVKRSGAIFTANELYPLCNFGSKEVIQRQDWPVDKAVGFKASEQFLKDDGVIIGVNEFAGKQTIIKQPSHIRDLHTSVGGLIGMGKSWLLESMILYDISRGEGVGVIDPHGDLIERIIRQIPEHRLDDCIFFSPCEEEYAVCYNPFELRSGEDIGKKVEDLVSVRSLYPANAWGSSIEAVLMTVFWTLLKAESTCLADARTLLSRTEEGYEMREKLLPVIDNPDVRMFWVDVFEHMPAATINRVLTKLSMFLLPEKVNRIFSQKENKIDFRKIIDEKKIFLGYIPAGRIGSDCTDTLGSTITSGFYNAGMSRQDQTFIPPNKRVPFNLYIDEFSRFSVKSFEDCLRELRKYQVRLILAYQQKESLSESVKSALGNVGTMIVLDVDWRDAQIIYKDFYGEVDHKDLMRKGKRRGLLKMKEEIASFKTIDLPQKLNGDGNKVREISVRKYYAPIKKEKNVQLNKQQKKKVNQIKICETHYDEI